MKTDITYIYALQDPITLCVRYVGKANDPHYRYRNHLNKCHNVKSHKRNWINKLRENGVKPILLILDVVPMREWKFWERFWIQQLKCWGFDLLNHTSGGDGLSFGNETSFRRGLIPWNKNKRSYFSKEARQRISEAHIGKRLSRAHKKKISKAQKGKPKPWFLNESLTEEQIKKRSKTQFKKGFVPWNKGKSGYTTSKKKPVLQLDLGGNIIKEYPGTKEAAKEMGCCSENIAHCCRVIIKQLKNINGDTKMNKKIILGLAGKKRSGKDTVAKMIVNIYQEEHYGITVFSFAQGLKEVAATALGLPFDHFNSDVSKEDYYWVGKKKGMSGREFLQKIGTECFRERISDDFWVYRLMSEIAKSNCKIAVISDVRFPNEYDAIKKRGGYVLRTERDTKVSDDHPSETSLDKHEFDHVFNNNGTIDQLKEQVRVWMRSTKLI